MGSHTFTWPHYAREVYVTGTFDNWQKTVKLDRHGDSFHKTVDLPSEKILYKFVVDGIWTTDHTSRQEQDHQGIYNNVLLAEELKPAPSSHSFLSSVAPTSTTAAMAGKAPLSRGLSDVRDEAPGAWPETPANELQQFSVAPIPATSRNPIPGGEGSSNPVKLAPGESVPEPSTFTSNTIDSHVSHGEKDLDEAHNTEGTQITHPAEEAERALGVAPLPATSSNPVPGGEGSSNPIKLSAGEPVPESSSYTSNTIDSHVKHEPADEEESAFGVAPLPATAGIGNPIHLPPGEPVPHPSTFTNNTVHSTVGDMRSASGAPQLPPALSPQSEKEAFGGSMFGLPPVGSGPGPMIPESSLPMGDGGEFAAPDFGAADFPTPHLSSVAPTSTTAMLAGQVPIRERGVPEVVTESERAAHESPEAAAFDEPVGQKSAVEDELKSKVPEAPGVDGVGHGNAADVPAAVTESQHRAHADPEAAASPVAVHDKSNMEDELKQTVHEEPATSESGVFGNSERGVTGAIAGGALAAGGAVAAAAYAAKDKAQPTLDKAAEYTGSSLDQATNKASELTGQTADKPVHDAEVPAAVIESQHAAHVSPEAAAEPEVVAEKSAMEKELQATVAKEPATSESGMFGASENGITGKMGAGVAAGTAALAGAAGIAGYSSSQHSDKSRPTTSESAVPAAVVESQHVAHASPEASAEPEAVAEKSAMEKELQRTVSKEPATSESGMFGASENGITGKIGAGIAAGTAAIAGAAGIAGYSPSQASDKSRPTTSESAVPATVVESQHAAHVSPEASAEPEVVAEKSAMEKELQRTVSREPATSESGLLGNSEGGISAKVGAGIAAGTAAVASAAGIATHGDNSRPTTSDSTVPAAVVESQHAAHVDPEASAEPEIVAEKSAMEQELQAKVAKEPATSESGLLGNSESGISGKVEAGVAAGAAAIAGAAGYAGYSAHSDKSRPTTSDSTVPAAVVESQHAAHVSPEASAEPEVVAEKSAMENELKSVVHEEPATSESGLLGSSEGGLMDKLSGTTAADKAIPSAPPVPSFVTDSQHTAHVSPEASADAEAVREKSAVEDELKEKVPEAPVTSESGLLGTSEGGISGKVATGVAAGTAAAGAAVAGYAYTARDKAAEATGQDKHTFLPPGVQSAIDSMNHSKGTTAPAGYTIGNSTFGSTSMGSSNLGSDFKGINDSVPETVLDSQKAAHVSPEAAANPEAVAEKSQFEKELLSAVKPHNEAGEPAPSSSAALSAVAPSGLGSSSVGLGSTGTGLGSPVTGLGSSAATTARPLDEPRTALPTPLLGASTSGHGLTASADSTPASAAGIAERAVASDVLPSTGATTGSAPSSPLRKEFEQGVAGLNSNNSTPQKQTPALAAATAAASSSSASAPATGIPEPSSMKKEKSPFDPKSDSDRLAAPATGVSDSRDVSPMSKTPRAPEEDVKPSADASGSAATTPNTTPQKDKVKRSSSFFRGHGGTPNSTKTGGTAGEESASSSPVKPKKKGFLAKLKDKLRG